MDSWHLIPMGLVPLKGPAGQAISSKPAIFWKRKVILHCLHSIIKGLNDLRKPWTNWLLGVCHKPGEVKLDLTFGLIARDWWDLNWKIQGQEGDKCVRCGIHHPWTLHSLETDWNSEWSHAGLWTTAPSDFCHPLVVCNSSKTEQKEGTEQWCRSRTSDKNM